MTTDSQDLTTEELEELKRERLQYTVEYAYEHSPFYRDLMDDHGIEPTDIRTFEELEKLPVVTGDDILKNQPPQTDKFRFKNPDANIRRPFLTSGSTGEPKTIFKSYDECVWIQRQDRRILEHFGVSTDDTVVSYLPFVGLNMSSFEMEGGIRQLGAESVPISNTPYPPDREFQLLRHHDPDVIIGLPSHIDAKGRALDAAGHDLCVLDIEKVLVGGEPVTDARRVKIERTWGGALGNIYASTETGACAASCHSSEYFHVIADSVHIEAVDRRSGEQVANGDRGLLAVTHLLPPGEESGMPLLRYATGDLGHIHSDYNGCNCSLSAGQLLAEPTRDDWERMVGGVSVTTLFAEEVIWATESLRDTIEEYQLRIAYDSHTGQDVLKVVLQCTDDSASGIEVQGVTRSGSPDNVAERIGQRLLEKHTHLHDAVETVGAARIDVKVVDDIDLGKGKPDRLIDTRNQ